ncbi:MAG: toxin-antitoxin system YwqK family antitoxin [Bacteroidia bacterium]
MAVQNHSYSTQLNLEDDHLESNLAYFPKNSLIYKISYKNKIPSGHFIVYYPDGNPLMEGHLDEAQFKDTVRIWHQHGILGSELVYKNNTLCGRMRTYKRDGVIENENIYNDSGYLIAERRFYDNGSKKSEVNYLEGSRKRFLHHGMQTYWHENGELSAKYVYDSGKLIDWAYSYHPNGQLSRKTYYIKGQKDSVETIYDEEGRIQYKRAYKENSYNGINMAWWKNGNLRWTGKYKNGKQDSIWYYYNEDGSQASVKSYKEGLLSANFSGRSCECVDSTNLKIGFAPLLNDLADLKTVQERSFDFHSPIGDAYNHLFYTGLQTSSSSTSGFYTFNLITFQKLSIQVPDKTGVHLILNPCVTLGRMSKPMRCHVNFSFEDKMQTDISIETDYLALRFNPYIVHRKDSGAPTNANKYALENNTELLFKAKSIDYNKRDYIRLNSVSDICFPHSEIGNSGIGLDLKSCEINLNPSSDLFKYRFKDYDYYTEHYGGYFNRKWNREKEESTSILDNFTGIYAYKCELDLPSDLFNTDSSFKVSGKDLILGGNFLVVTARLKASIGKGLNYTLNTGSKSYTFFAKDIEEKLKAKGFDKVKTTYDEKTSEFIIYLFLSL